MRCVVGEGGEEEGQREKTVTRSSALGGIMWYRIVPRKEVENLGKPWHPLSRGQQGQ